MKSKHAPARKSAPKAQTHPEETPKVAVDHDQLVTILTQFYRGTAPDVSHLSAVEKEMLAALVQADTQAETIFKFPDRENQRQRLRDLLG